MKRKLLFLSALAIMMASCSQADLDSLDPTLPVQNGSTTLVPLDSAVKKAEWYVNSLNKENQTRSRNLKVDKVEFYAPSLSTRSESNPSYYIINFDNDEGFAVVPADTRLPEEAYAFSNEGSISISDTIQNKPLKLFFESLPTPEEALNTRSVGDGEATPNNLMIEKVVSPMFGYEVSHWTQLEPYNQYCPVKNDTVCPVGCPAMGAGMILSHFRHPSSYNGYSFPWHIITLGSAKSYTARMLQQVGLPENMNVIYTKTASGIISPLLHESIFNTFKNMGYEEPECAIINEEDMINSLSEGSPILVAGAVKGSNSGHVWNIDGYGKLIRYQMDANGNRNTIETLGNYFHCVWGWGGKSNGYFKCYNLGTSSAGIGGTSQFSDEGYRQVTVDEFNSGNLGFGVAIYFSFKVKS